MPDAAPVIKAVLPGLKIEVGAMIFDEQQFRKIKKVYSTKPILEEVLALT